MTRAKVFCVGFQKTGTTSLNAALTGLGYRVATVFGRKLSAAELRATAAARGIAIARDYDAVEDMPWPLLYRDLDAAYPGSRFILTWRETDRWLASICDHFGDHPAELQKFTYGDDAPAPVGHEARYTAVYERHNAAVREHFRDRPDHLLEMNLSQGDGWDKLAPFLGISVPDDTPFPRANSATHRRSLAYRLAPAKVVRKLSRRLGKLGSALPGRGHSA